MQLDVLHQVFFFLYLSYLCLMVSYLFKHDGNKWLDDEISERWLGLVQVYPTLLFVLSLQTINYKYFYSNSFNYLLK